jgi:signal transduction histidine kinase
LHDGIGQLLSAIKFNIELAERQEFKDPTLITKAKDQLVMAGKEIKNIILSVYPVILENAGLLPAIEELCTEIEQNSHLQINRFLEETGNRFPLKTELSMYRIIQESLNNIIKHAKASKVDIMLKRQHGIVAISVTDNGIGFNTESMTFRGNLKSLGLIRMKERVGLLNGSFYIDSEIGKGATIHIEVPIEEN